MEPTIVEPREPEWEDGAVLRTLQERWQAYEEASLKGLARLDFFLVGTWLFFPLAIDTRALQEARARASLLGMTWSGKAFQPQEKPAQAQSGQELLQVWEDARRQILHERAFMTTVQISLTSIEELVLSKFFKGFVEPNCCNHQYHKLLQSFKDIRTQEPISPTIQERINELCFLAGVILRWGPVCEKEWLTRHDQVIKEQRFYTSLNSHIQRAPLLSESIKVRMAEEVDIITRALQSLCQRREVVTAIWKKLLGVDKRLAVAARKNRVWSLVFRELVDLVLPFSEGPKKHYVPRRGRDPGRHFPEQAFELASQLMHLAFPELWPDRPDLIKGRYYK